MSNAFLIFGLWFALSLVASPMIGVLGRANDAPARRRP